MPEFEPQSTTPERPTLDTRVWGDSEVVFHDGETEKSWMKVDESDLVDVEP